MKYWLIPVALVAGTFNAIEAGTNTALRKGLAAPIWSVAIISIITLACACVAALLVGERVPTLASAATVPWWGWLGGLLGFGFVMAMVFTAEPLGAALFIGLTVTASISGSVVLDHFGLLGFAVHPAGPARLAGVALMVIGVALVARF